MHILQPKHILLKKDEVNDILKKYNISLTQIPQIKISDAALPEGAAIGDVIKIERKCPETGEISVFYRVVSI